jgi:hypothetical protein
LGAVLAVFTVVVACSSDSGTNVPCNATSCSCMGDACGGNARLDCGSDEMCAPTCSNFGSSCNAQCGDGCMFQCMSGPGCAITCGDQCTIACQGSTTCAATCGAGCNYTCTNVNDCGPNVGDGSDVTCNMSAGCMVICTGTCRVHCIATNPCTASCPNGEAPTQCSDGWACGESC